MCGSRNCPYSPMEGHWKFLVGWVLKSQTLEEKYEAKLEFPGECGVQKKTFFGGSMDIFWNYTLVKNVPAACYMYLLQVLIVYCVVDICCDWPSITLVLALHLSLENSSIQCHHTV